LKELGGDGDAKEGEVRLASMIFDTHLFLSITT